MESKSKPSTNELKVLVTGANGFIGNAVAKSFRRSGWKVYGQIRRESDATDLLSHEIIPVIGSPNPTLVDVLGDNVFDVIVSNTDDMSNPEQHFQGVQKLLNVLGLRAIEQNKRSLVMFTSGCKDYGKMEVKHGEQGSAPHTENSPLNPPSSLVHRTNFGNGLLTATDNPFDVIVLRPTIVYGLSSSHYGYLFLYSSYCRGTLEFIAHPNSIMHSLHVDDCADAYVFLAEFPDRSRVLQQAFNISGEKYETAQQVAEALAKSYNLTLKLTLPTKEVDIFGIHGLFNFNQWVGSDKLRALGWRDKHPSFSEGILTYRAAYEVNTSKWGRTWIVVKSSLSKLFHW